MSALTCTKPDVPDGTPPCIRRKIKSLMREPARNPAAAVWKWEANGKTFYYIPPYCCDAMSELYNEKCDLVCRPDGGFSGGGDGKCPAEITQSDTIIKTLIWKDTR